MLVLMLVLVAGKRLGEQLLILNAFALLPLDRVTMAVAATLFKREHLEQARRRAPPIEPRNRMSRARGRLPQPQDTPQQAVSTAAAEREQEEGARRLPCYRHRLHLAQGFHLGRQRHRGDGWSRPAMNFDPSSENICK